MLTITFYSKPNCCLCDQALEQIESARRQFPFDLKEVNILSDPKIYARFRHDIPLVQLNGVEIFRFRLTSEDLLNKLRAATAA